MSAPSCLSSVMGGCVYLITLDAHRSAEEMLNKQVQVPVRRVPDVTDTTHDLCSRESKVSMSRIITDPLFL